MDQLKLALEHKFWILAGLAILLPPIGWWAATDNLAKETDDREKKLLSIEKKLDITKACPNERWIDGAKGIGRELNISVSESQERLFDHQKGVMTCPDVVQDALTKAKVTYRHEGTPTDDFLAAKTFFVGCYADDWKSVINLVKPFKITTGEGLVLLPQSDSGGNDDQPINRHNEVDQWRQSLGFTGLQMWDVQEDLWFLRALMQAIARVNEGTTEIGNARIKSINQAILRGGDESDLATRRTPKAGSATPGAVSGGRSRISGPASGAGSSDSTYKPPKSFDPDDDFGDDGSKSSTPGDARGKKSDGTSGEMKRWVQATPKWNKRGFVLQLVMDEREIPTLLTALSESPFPIEIRHVEHRVYSGGASKNFGRMISAAAEAAGQETTVETSKEQQQQQQRITDGLRMAFNMHYLADVTIDGTLTIYNEPSAAAKPAPSTSSGSSQTVAESARATGGTKDANSAISGTVSAKSASPKSTTAKSSAGPTKSATASKGSRTTATQATKSGALAVPPTSGTKTTPSGSATPPVGK
jgi:hypothetical protein